MTTKVKNKKDFEEIRKEYRKDNEKIKERLKKKDYICFASVGIGKFDCMS